MIQLPGPDPYDPDLELFKLRLGIVVAFGLPIVLALVALLGLGSP